MRRERKEGKKRKNLSATHLVIDLPAGPAVSPFCIHSCPLPYVTRVTYTIFFPHRNGSSFDFCFLGRKEGRINSNFSSFPFSKVFGLDGQQ